MPKFETSVQHQLEIAEAQQRLISFSEEVREKFAGQVSEMVENWDDAGNLQFGFKVMGLKIDGNMIIEQETVTVKGNIPFAAVVFKGKIEQDINDQLQQALNE